MAKSCALLVSIPALSSLLLKFVVKVNVVNADQCKKMPSTSSQHPRPVLMGNVQYDNEKKKDSQSSRM